MPQVKESLLRRLVKRALNEAELTAGDTNTKFNISVDLGNPQSETKLGIRVKLTPKEGMLEPDTRDKLSVAIMKKLNSSLGQYDIQVSKDTDASTQSPEVIGFFIPLSQIKNMIINSIKGPGEPKGPTSTDDGEVERPKTLPKPPGLSDLPDGDEEEIMEQEDPLDRAARLAKEPIAGMGLNTGLGLKRKGYENEKGGKLSTKELYQTASTVKDGMLALWSDIVNESDYKFKEYLTNNEDQWVRAGAVVSMITDELEDRLEAEEPVGPDQSIEEVKKIIKSQINEMRQRELNEISKVVNKDDFYSFINAGNNVLRTLEENGMNHINGKKYLTYLVKHNIM